MPLDEKLFPEEARASKRVQAEIDSQTKQRRKDLHEVLATPAGVRVMKNIIDRCGVLQTTFTGNSNTYFREGVRAVGLLLLRDIESVNDNAYMEMFKHNNKQKKEEGNARTGY